MARLSEHLAAARAALDSGAADRTLATCRNVMAQFPKHIEATALLAEALVLSGQLEEGDDLVQRVLSADPEHLRARRLLVDLSLASGNVNGARQILAATREIAPRHDETRAAARELGLAEWPERSITRAALARHYFESGRFRRAVGEFAAAISADPTRLDLWVGLVEARWRSGDLEGAVVNARQVLATAPDCLKVLIVMAASGSRAEFWERARELDPTHTVASQMLAGSPVLPPRGDDPEVGDLPGKELSRESEPEPAA